jgi:hypothetical protein
MLENEIQSGIVRAINYKSDKQGNRLITLDVQSLEEMSIIRDVAIDSPLFAQYIPVIGQIVLLQRVGSTFTKVMGYFGDRLFHAPIQPGEALIEGHGGGFMYLNNGGDVVVSDQVLGNVIRLLNTVGISVTADSISINVKGVGQLNITPVNADTGTKNSIEFIKVGTDNKPTAKFTVTDEKVAIDAPKVELGLQTNTIEAGMVVSSSQVYGTHSICPITGQPIPRALHNTVKLDAKDHPMLT